MSTSPIDTHYPLSSPQLDIWFDQLLHPDVPLYNTGGYVRIHGEINPSLFEQALNHVIATNDALRTRLHPSDPLPTQTFAAKDTLKLNCHDFSNHPQPEAAAIEWMQQTFVQPFSLYECPLFEFALCKTSPTSYCWLKKYHHIIVDGWATSLIVQQVAQAYTALAHSQPLPTQHYAYQAFIEDDAHYTQSNKFQQAKAYWQAKFTTLPEPLIPPRYRSQFPPHSSIPSHRATLCLARPFYNQLLAFTIQHKVSILHVVIAALYIYFTRTAQREAFSIGLFTLNRKNAQFKNTVGLFTTGSPAHFSVGAKISFVELVKQINQTLQKDYRHQRFPMGEINHYTGQHGHQTLYDITLSYAKFDFDIKFGTSAGRTFYFHHGFDQNPLAMFVEEFHEHDDVNIYFDYNLGFFNASEIEQLKIRFEHVLRIALQQPEQPLQTLPIVPAAELTQLLTEWNRTVTDYPHDSTVVDLFEQQAAATPDHTAVVFQQTTLTYAQLNQRANQLARHLQTLAVQANDLVGLCVEASPEMVVGLLGILKAGGAYVPLDPNYPAERLAFMLENAQANVLLTQQKWLAQLPPLAQTVLCLDRDAPSLAQQATENLPVRPQPEQLIYVIYTSGSTGKPKGTALYHRGFQNLVNWFIRDFGLTHTDRVLVISSFSFDLTQKNFFAPLLVGGQLHLLPPTPHYDPQRITGLVAEQQITWLNCTPSAFYVLLEPQEPATFNKLVSLRYVFLGGEPIALPRLATWLQADSCHAKLVNTYGPTECTDICAAYTVERPALFLRQEQAVPIGKPIANVQLFVLDEHLAVLPIGVAGELHIGGAGVGQGYLHRSELTAEKFIPNPFSREPDARLYKTGDLVRYLPEGHIEYLGRIDNQVKIRGFRIELGEIETALSQHTDVQEVAVVMQQDRLIAYLVSDLMPDRIPYQADCLVQSGGDNWRMQTVDICNGGLCLQSEATVHFTFQQPVKIRLQSPINAEFVWLDAQVRWQRGTEVGLLFKPKPAEFKLINDNVLYILEETGVLKMLQRTLNQRLRNFLKDKLPDYMVPSHFLLIPALPLTPNGKVDRRALAQLNPTSHHVEENFAAPRTPDEELLASIWASVLEIKRVGIYDNFFTLGGHSLLATQVMSRCRSRFEVDLPLRALFDNPTIAGLSAQIQAVRQQATEQTIPRVDRNQPLYPSFAQQRLWFLDRLEGQSATYNLNAAVQLEGELNQLALECSFQYLVQRHESLRMCFPMQDGVPTVHILTTTFQLLTVDLSHLPPSEQAPQTQRLLQAEAARPFNLATEPLFRAQLLKLGTLSHILQLNMHHIISDGWSMGVFVREWRVVYAGMLHDDHDPLAPLPIQYVDFAHWQRQWLTETRLAKQLAYWREKLLDIPTLLELPTDYPRPPIQRYQGARVAFTLSDSLTTRIKQLCQQTETTLFMVLWSAFAVLLTRYSGQTDIVIGSPIANRTHNQTEGLIGFFVNTLVLRLNLAANPTFNHLLQQAKPAALEAYANQDAPFERLVEMLQPQRNLSYTPLFQVMLVLHNIRLPDLTLAGLQLNVLALQTTRTKFDLTLDITETATGLTGYFEYNTDLFASATIERWVAHWEILLTAIVDAPDTPIRILPLLTHAEQQQFAAWNATAVAYPDGCIHELFEAQVMKTPDAIAAILAEQNLTYQQLNQQANQLAHYLHTLGVKPDGCVGIYVEHSLEMVIGLFAILKAGGAYVPLDPSSPPERLAFMLADAQVPVLLTQTTLLETLPSTEAYVICLDVELPAISTQPTTNLTVTVRAENLAYVIYTSGSTGKPKGTLIEHRGLSNYLHWSLTYYPVREGAGAPVYAPLGFDATITSLFLPLLVGQKILLLPPATDAEAILPALQEYQDWSLVKLTPAHLDLLNARLPATHLAGKTRCLVLGGEELISTSLILWQQNTPKTRIINEYGPTETVVGCCVYEVQTDTDTDHSHHSPTRVVPIGRPIANTQLHVLDEFLQPLPIGVPGELHIGGAGLARGYLNQPELTTEKFIPNPFSEASGARLYKTGDLARYRPDGHLEYVGRIDNQVKIRGFRIELGEIEAVLAEHPSVAETAVVVHEVSHTDKRLIAYCVPQFQPTLENAELHAFLAQRLPDYMQPALFVTLEHLPLTPNGKLDRRALSHRPLEQTPASTASYVAPRTPDEQTLAAIWATALKIEQVSIHDNFFALGGHSLLAVSLLTQIEQQFNLHLPLATLFQSPTIAEFAQLLHSTQESRDLWAPLVTIQATKPPFFCLPGAGGNVLYLYQLARHLGAAQPFYALQSIGLDGETPPDTQVEVMAARYLKAIQTVQPRGPYWLGGHSFGSAVGLEMCKQLQQQGEAVARLIVFDTTPPYNRAIGSDWDDTQWITDVAHVAGRLLGIELGLSYAELAQRSAEAQLEYLHDALQQHGWVIGLKQLRAFVQIFKAHCQMCYMPTDVPRVPISLFKARELPPESRASAQMEQFSQALKQSSDWGWGAFAEGAVDVHLVPGDHHTMMCLPHVEVLAEELKPCFEM